MSRHTLDTTLVLECGVEVPVELSFAHESDGPGIVDIKCEFRFDDLPENLRHLLTEALFDQLYEDEQIDADNWADYRRRQAIDEDATP